MNTILSNIRSELIQQSDEKTKQSGQRFFKEQIKLYGVKTAVVEKIGKDYFQSVKDKNKHEIFQLCEALWKSGYMEESFIACNWSFYVRKQYEKKDIMVFKKWISQYVGNWASCDTLCNHSVGTLVEMFPPIVEELKQWTKSSNRWMQRASAVSLIVPARKGLFLKDIFEIAARLLKSKDDLVQKGYGWMLKAASQAHQKEVFDYVIANKEIMPRTALRYAIEKMPEKLKKEAMKKDV